VLGFLTGRIIWALQLDHIYTADYFLLLLALLGASLAACTATNQWPAVKVAQRWRFKGDQASLARLQVASLLPNARLQDLGAALRARRYQVFMQDGRLYGFKGLAGKLGPIGVHASMLLCMVGFAMGARELRGGGEVETCGGGPGRRGLCASAPCAIASCLQARPACARGPPRLQLGVGPAA
jgi:cytochrome c biogenesis protein